MGWVKLVVGLVVVTLVVGVASLFGIQNNQQTAMFVLDLFFVKFQSSNAVAVPILMGASVLGGFLLGLFLPGPIAMLRNRRLRRLESELTARGESRGSF